MKSEYYEITKNTDTTEGRGLTVGTGIFFWNYSDALEFVKSDRYCEFGIMGTPGGEYDIKKHSSKIPKIYDSIKNYDEEHSIVKLKQSALKKLTKEEKRALGILS